jgi:hypothetical protein
MPNHIWTLDSVHAPNFVAALERLNHLYGRGEVIGLSDFTTQGPAQHVENGHGHAICRKQYGQDIAKWRVVNGTLYFRGHQQKLADPFGA